VPHRELQLTTESDDRKDPERSDALCRHLEAVLERVHEVEQLLQAANEEIHDLRQRLAAAEQDARNDPLTGIANRRGFQLRLASEVQASRERPRQLALLMVDVDHFKLFNDLHGHQAGDHVLRLVANSLRRREADDGFAARLGGDEFTLLLPGAGLAEAARLAEDLRELLAERRFVQRVAGVELTAITVSIGVGALSRAETGRSLVRRVDAALYRAKQGGRNRVEVDHGGADHPVLRSRAAASSRA
jgi:diguanylate cyclase